MQKKLNHLLKPKVFLKIVTFSLAFCILSMGLFLIVLSSPYRDPQDLRKQADNGLQRSCNQYCADSSECQSDLTCWFNQCRRPDNVDNNSCAAPPVNLQRDIQTSCNQPCTTNSNCPVNMRCYLNQCRLAINPSSSTCQLSTLDNIDPEKSLSKGAVVPVSPTQIITPSVTVTQEPTFALTPSPTLFISPTTYPTTLPVINITKTTPNDLTDDTDASSDIQEISILTTLQSWLKSINSSENINTRRLLMVITSSVLLLIGIYFVITSLNRKNSQIDDESDYSLKVVPKSETKSSSAPPTTMPQSSSVPKSISSAQLYPSGGMTARLKQKGVTSPT